MRQVLENLNDILIGWGRVVGILKYERWRYAKERYMQCLGCCHSRSLFSVKFCGVCRCVCIAKAATNEAAYKCPMHIWRPFNSFAFNTKTRKRSEIASFLIDICGIDDEKELAKRMRDAGFVGPDNKIIARHAIEFFK